MAGGGHVGGMYGKQVIALQVNDGMAENIAQRIARSGGGAVDGGKLPVQQDEHGAQRRNQRFEKALVQKRGLCVFQKKGAQGFFGQTIDLRRPAEAGKRAVPVKTVAAHIHKAQDFPVIQDGIHVFSHARIAGAAEGPLFTFFIHLWLPPDAVRPGGIAGFDIETVGIAVDVISGKGRHVVPKRDGSIVKGGKEFMKIMQIIKVSGNIPQKLFNHVIFLMAFSISEIGFPGTFPGSFPAGKFPLHYSFTIAWEAAPCNQNCARLFRF